MPSISSATGMASHSERRSAEPEICSDVSFTSPWRKFDELGHITDANDAAAAEAAMAVFAHRLDWWADALAHARHAKPYDPRDDG